MSRPALRLLAAAAIGLALVEGTAAEKDPRPCPSSDTDRRIAFEEQRIAASPGLYPAHARLGGAYLEKARESGDPGWLAKARDSLNRSMALQPTWEAMMAAASLESYSHRFEEALAWARKAAGSSPREGPDGEAIGVEVEALIGLGRAGEAGGVLDAAEARDAGDDHHLAIARGQWLNDAGRIDEAVAAFDRAARIARRENAASLEAWSRIAAAGILIDSGRAVEAIPYLDAARAIDRCRPELVVHQAEWAAATGRPGEALAALEALLDRTGDPRVAHLAFVVADDMGRRRSARRLFKRASSAYKRAIAAGEIHTLGALGRLLLDAGVRPDRAVDLARENLRHRRDREARELLHRALAAPHGR